MYFMDVVHALTQTQEGFDHFVWLQQASMQTLQSIVEHRMWCCSLDVAVLAVLGCALARLSPFHPLRLRFVASARDQGDEGNTVIRFWMDFGDEFEELEVGSAQFYNLYSCLTKIFQSTYSIESS